MNLDLASDEEMPSLIDHQELMDTHEELGSGNSTGSNDHEQLEPSLHDNLQRQEMDFDTTVTAVKWVVEKYNRY